jgi:F-type H+-transporting ATPase subunit a
MGDLKEKIMEELNCETVFTIHIGNFNIPIAESTVITWVIMVILLVLCIFLTRGLKVKNVSKRQLVAESIVGWLEKFVIGMTGEEGKAFVPYLCSVLLYIGFANLIGLCGVKPPTKDLNVTAALAVMSIVLVQYAGIHKKGFKGWIKSFTQPMAIVTPINILELFIKPLSLCMRLFGNVLGAFVIMELLKSLIPVVLPVPFSFYFDIFDGLIQAYVFVFLTSLYIKEAVEE